jgi:hypothetical protein
MKTIVATYKQYFTRGMTWFSYIFQFSLITVNAKLFEEFFKTTFGWDVFTTVVVGCIAFVVGVIVVGKIDFSHGVWKTENDFVWDSTPRAKQMSDSVQRIEAMLKKKESG